MGEFELGEYESRLIATIYEAALDSTRWRGVLAEICQFVDADDAALIFYDEQHWERSFCISARHQAVYLLDSFQSAEDLGAIKYHVAGSEIGQPVSFLQNSVVPKKLVQTNILAISELPTAINGLLLPLLQGDMMGAALQVFTLPESQVLPPKSIEFIQLLSPHLVRAMFLHNHISVLKAETSSLLDAIKSTSLAVFLLDKNLRVVFSSPEAEAVLNSHQALSLSRTQHLQAHIQQEQIGLEARLIEFLDAGFHARHLASEGISLPLYHPQKSHPLKLCFLPIQQVSGDPSEGQAYLAVFVNDPERQRFISPQYLKQAYKFTQTETQLAQLLLKGMGTAEISTARSTSAETTRWQLKQLMHKTQTHSQAELTRLLILLTNDFCPSRTTLPKK